MKYYDRWWGVNEHISPEEIACRAFVMFIITLCLLRFSNMRPFGKGTAFDNAITILLGGILSRGVIGATPFISTVAAGIVIMIFHGILGEISVRYKKWEGIIKGHSILVFQNGLFLQENLDKANLTVRDVYEDLRLKCHANDLEEISEIYSEATGELSFVKKKS